MTPFFWDKVPRQCPVRDIAAGNFPKKLFVVFSQCIFICLTRPTRLSLIFASRPTPTSAFYLTARLAQYLFILPCFSHKNYFSLFPKDLERYLLPKPINTIFSDNSLPANSLLAPYFLLKNSAARREHKQISTQLLFSC